MMSALGMYAAEINVYNRSHLASLRSVSVHASREAMARAVS